MNGTSYFEVYKRAITEFKDPTLKALLENNTILFSETMHNFLVNAISLFTNPLKASQRLHDVDEPYILENNFISDGTTNTFVLEKYPGYDSDDTENIDYDDFIFEYRIDGEITHATYTEETHSVTFDDIPLPSSNISVNIYYIGGWNVKLYDEEAYILSQFIVACWSEFIANDKLDIVRLLGDTDFILSSNATTTQAKTHWNVVNREVVTKRMNKYAWDCLSMGRYR